MIIKLSLILGLLFYTTSLFSAGLDESSNSPKVSSSAYKKLKTVEALIDKSSYTKALGLLKDLLTNINDKAFDKALVLRSMASVYALQKNYTKAANAMQQCLATKALYGQEEQQTLINLAQIYIKQSKYKQAADLMEPWIAKAKKVTTDDYILLANVYAQIKHYRKAISHVKKAIASTKYPKESWLKLMLALNYELKDYAATASVLKDLIRRFPPQKQYWDQLASVHQQMKQYKKAVSIKELAYHSGFLTEQKEIVDLANFFLFVEAPYKGAGLMEKELASGRIKKTSKNYELLANAWTQAKEYSRASAALQKASALSNKGELSIRLGRILIAQENWSGARDALVSGFKKGKLKDPGTAYVLLGMVNFELKLTRQAKIAFSKAIKYTKTKKTAQQWLKYIRSEA